MRVKGVFSDPQVRELIDTGQVPLNLLLVDSPVAIHVAIKAQAFVLGRFIRSLHFPCRGIYVGVPIHGFVSNPHVDGVFSSVIEIVIRAIRFRSFCFKREKSFILYSLGAPCGEVFSQVFVIHGLYG